MNLTSNKARTDPFTNKLLVTVRDVSGNTSQQTRTVARTNNMLEMFQYDGNGNLTNWVCGTTNWGYQWDWADRLTKATSNGVVVLENWYDASSRRIAKTEVVNGQTQKWLYLSDGWDIVGVMDASGQLLETYTRGVGLAGDIGTLVAVTHHTSIAVTTGTYYTHHNHRGDIVRTRNGATTTGTHEYSAFGKVKSQTGTDVCRFKFSSKERDVATGFSYYGFRFYAPQWQRWPNRDTLVENGGLNLYSYVGNDPISLIDTTGLIPAKVIKILPSLIGGTASRLLKGDFVGCLDPCKNSTISSCQQCCINQGLKDIGISAVANGLGAAASGGIGIGISVGFYLWDLLDAHKDIKQCKQACENRKAVNN